VTDKICRLEDLLKKEQQKTKQLEEEAGSARK